MNNYILISKTFTEITPESAENSDFSNSGFIDKKIKVSFRELVDLMKAHTMPSQSPNDMSIAVWYESGYYTSDYRTGTERSEAIHFHRDNPQNVIKYWELARIAANK